MGVARLTNVNEWATVLTSLDIMLLHLGRNRIKGIRITALMLVTIFGRENHIGYRRYSPAGKNQKFVSPEKENKH